MARKTALPRFAAGAFLAAILMSATPLFAWGPRSRFVFPRPHARFHAFARPFVPRVRFVPRPRFFHPHFAASVFVGYPYPAYAYSPYSYYGPYAYYGPPAVYCSPGY